MKAHAGMDGSNYGLQLQDSPPQHSAGQHETKPEPRQLKASSIAIDGSISSSTSAQGSSEQGPPWEGLQRGSDNNSDPPSPGEMPVSRDGSQHSDKIQKRIEFDTPQADRKVSATEATQIEDRNSPRLRIQEKAHRQASKMSLPEFRRKCCFRWPSKSNEPESNRLILQPGQHVRLNKYLGSVGSSQKAVINTFEVTAEYGLEDTLVVKEIRCTEDDEKRKVYQEIINIKDLNHNHIIAFLGTYIAEERIGILMFPVASYNLKEFMDLVSVYNKNNSNDLSTPEHEHVHLLRTYPACLCQALNYLHEVMKIKHKDIKPENILIDRHDSIIITDFGISTRHTDSTNPITYGPTGYTAKYGAPEVIDSQDEVGVGRDYDVDTFSLGCVMLEMANAIYGESFDNMYEVVGKPVLPKDGGTVVAYNECGEEAHRWVSHLLKKGKGIRTMVSSTPPVNQLSTLSVAPTRDFDQEMFSMILKMMSRDPKERPSLQTVWELLDTATPPCEQCHPLFNHSVSNWKPRKLGTTVSLLDPSSLAQNVASSDKVPKLTLTDTAAKPTTNEHDEGRRGSLPDTPPDPNGAHDTYNPSLLQGPTSSNLPPLASDTGTMPLLYQSKKPSPPMGVRSPDRLSVPRNPSRVARESKLPENGPIEANGNNEEANEYAGGGREMVPHRLQHAQIIPLRPRPSGDQAAAPKPYKRLFSLGRNPNITVLSEDTNREILMCTEEKKIVLLDGREGKEDLCNGVFMRIPHHRRKMRSVKGDLDLWKLVSIRLNVHRFFGRLNLMFFRGNYPDSQLLQMPGRPEESHNRICRPSSRKIPKQPVANADPVTASSSIQ